MNDDLAYYSALRYPVLLTLVSDDGEEYWAAEFPDLPGCLADGQTPDEAVENATVAKDIWIEAELDAGRAVPEPAGDRDYSGRFVVRMPRSLHRRLALTAQREGVSLNQQVVSRLAETNAAAESTPRKSTAPRRYTGRPAKSA